MIKCPTKGRGVITNRDFKKGEFVVEYAGEIVTYSEAVKREEKYDEDIGCYMFFFRHKGRSYW